jgi:hypothetical protein
MKCVILITHSARFSVTDCCVFLCLHQMYKYLNDISHSVCYYHTHINVVFSLWSFAFSSLNSDMKLTQGNIVLFLTTAAVVRLPPLQLLLMLWLEQLWHFVAPEHSSCLFQFLSAFECLFWASYIWFINHFLKFVFLICYTCQHHLYLKKSRGLGIYCADHVTPSIC